jgi:hypothetical protein
MLFNVILYNILVISWRSILLVDDTGVPRETIVMLQVTDNFITESCISSTLQHEQDLNSQP